MIRIFITEYIVFIEDFNFSFIYDNFFPQYVDYCHQDFYADGWLNYRKYILRTESLTWFKKNKLWRLTNSNGLQNFRLIARNGWWIYFNFYMLPRKWFSESNIENMIFPYQYIYVQFEYLNHTVGQSFCDWDDYLEEFEQYDYITVDLNLLYNSVYEIWPSEKLNRVENMLNSYGAVVYRVEPFRKELVLTGLTMYKKYMIYGSLNPYNLYISEGLLYARKWTLYFYMMYVEHRLHPITDYWYLLSNFFPNSLYFWFIGFSPRFGIFSFVNFYLLNNFYLFKIYFSVNLFFIFCFIYIFFCNKKKLYFYIYLIEPYFYFKQSIGIFLNILSFMKKLIRTRKYYFLKKMRQKVRRKSDTENYYFNLIKKYYVKRLFKLYFSFVLGYEKYFEKMNAKFLCDQKNFTLLNCIFLILIMIGIWFLRIIIFLKNFIYLLNYFYYLKFLKFLRLPRIDHYKNTIFFPFWYIYRIIYIRDVEQVDGNEIIRRFLNYKNYHRKREYKKDIKAKILKAYETKMWEMAEIEDSIKQQYINYYYYRIFVDYEPVEELYYLFLTKIPTKFLLGTNNISDKKLRLYQLSTIFNLYYSKAYFLRNQKYFRLLYIKNFFYNRNFRKLYYFYIYKRLFENSYKSLRFFKIWFFYIWKLYLKLYFLFTYLFYFIFTKQRIIFPYYFYLSLERIYLYLNNYIFYFYLFKLILLLYFFFFLSFFYIYDLFKAYIIQFHFFIFYRLNNLNFYLFKSTYGFSTNFWYKYYMLKFYLFEYNIFYHIFIYIRNLIFNLIVICSFFYVFFSLPFIQDIMDGHQVLFIMEILINFFIDLNITSYFDYTLNIDNIYYFNAENFKYYFDIYLDSYYNNYINIDKQIFDFISINSYENVYRYKEYYWDMLYHIWFKIIKRDFVFFGFSIYEFHQALFPIIPKWYLYLYMHFILYLTKNPIKVMMYDIYWYNLIPIYIMWLLKVKYYIIYYYLLLPCYWIWQHLYTFIVFYCLYIPSLIPIPIYYIPYIFFKIIYIFYSYIYLFFLYFIYIYVYYFLAIYNILYSYIINGFKIDDLLKYDSLKYFISLDIYNFIKLGINIIFIFLYYLFSGIIISFYKIVSFFFVFFGFTYVENIDNFSYNYLSELRTLMGKFFTKIIYLTYDLNELNSFYDERAQNKIGRKRGLKIKHNKVNRLILIVKLRMVTFEYRIRGYLYKSNEQLIDMVLFENIFNFKNWNLLYFMFFSLYFHYFLILLFSGIIYIKYIELFKDTRNIPHSATYEWKRSFTRKNKKNLGYDEFYWLYNAKWLKSFEFYLDKYFIDDLYVYKFKRDKYGLSYFFLKSLNDLFIINNPTIEDYIFESRYFKLRKYYLSRYTIFIKDIDYLFHIFHVSKKNLRTRSKIFSFFKYNLPFMKKKKNELNYIYDNEMLNNLDRMDYFWLYYVTPYLLYGRDWYDMKVFSQDLISKDLYSKIKKCLFKAYSIFEMNQKEFPLDLFEFQFFDKDFFNFLWEHCGNDADSNDLIYENPILRRIIYSRFATTLLYTSFDGKDHRKLYNSMDYEDHIYKVETYLIYLKEINKNYFNNFISFDLFSFMESITYTLTHLDPNIMKTAVDIDRGNLIGVSYKKSMLLDEFTSTEITESVYDSIDTYIQKASFNNMSMNKILLREDVVAGQNKIISPWWVVLVILPFFVLYIDLNFLFKYSRFILPHFAIIDGFKFFGTQIFDWYTMDKYSWHRIFIHDHLRWSKRLKYQLKKAHIRTPAWDSRWMEFQSFWVGEYSHFFKAKLDYSWLYVFISNDFYSRKFLTKWYYDFYLKDLLKFLHVHLLFILVDFISFTIFWIMLFFVFQLYFIYIKVFSYSDKYKFEQDIDLEYYKHQDAEKILRDRRNREKQLKAYKFRNKFADLNEKIEQHKKLIEFIEKYKEKEKEKEENKKNL